MHFHVGSRAGFPFVLVRNSRSSVGVLFHLCRNLLFFAAGLISATRWKQISRMRALARSINVKLLFSPRTIEGGAERSLAQSRRGRLFRSGGQSK
ncbi:hypothetical protein FHS27_006340 [Rhodopirellula rubra]|uniref:Uncharacterized protein n=1 Tax=Aporhodopirellula rubra TaxID=980271 RepID=A0A7W5E6I7_9BACT|nr:hypothetical protein [Aporhodopirellula rubra]